MRFANGLCQGCSAPVCVCFWNCGADCGDVEFVCVFSAKAQMNVFVREWSVRGVDVFAFLNSASYMCARGMRAARFS